MDSKQLEKRKKVLLDLMNDKIYVPIKELAIILQVSKEERPDLELVLNELLAEGKIEISKRGKYKIAKEKTVTGTFVTHPKGFGFIEVEGRDDDIYVSEENIGNAFYGDVVQATLISGTTGKRQEGRITQVISHTVTEVVGIYEQSKHFGFVIPDNQKILQDIFIPQECAKGAVNGHKVIAEITSYGSNKKKPEGRITKIIGHISDPGTDVLSIVYAKDLPFEFPEKVLNQAERVKDEVRADWILERYRWSRSMVKMPRIWMMLYHWKRMEISGIWACISQMSQIMCRRTVHWTGRQRNAEQVCILWIG